MRRWDFAIFCHPHEHHGLMCLVMNRNWQVTSLTNRTFCRGTVKATRASCHTSLNILEDSFIFDCQFLYRHKVLAIKSYIQHFHYYWPEHINEHIRRACCHTYGHIWGYVLTVGTAYRLFNIFLAKFKHYDVQKYQTLLTLLQHAKHKTICLNLTFAKNTRERKIFVVLFIYYYRPNF